MSNEGEDLRVQLARMEGKLDLSNARHDGVDKRLDNHEQRLHRHANDISVLQAAEHMRKGFGKFLHWVGGGGVVGLLALVARHFGV